jgi:AbrB family looped-hinge helix DNA binding protein
MIGKNMMSTIATTKMSSKGQIVIPEEIRRKLGLKAGAKFVVLGEDDVVILKAIAPPSREEFDNLLKKARNQANLAGLTKKDIRNIIDEVRGH